MTATTPPAQDPTVVLPSVVDETDSTEPPHQASTAGWVLRGAVGLALVWLVFFLPINFLSPFEVSGSDANRMSEAAIFAIIGLSLNVLIGYTGTLSLGHQAFVGIGAFTSAFVVTDMTQEVVLGVLVAAIVGGLQALVLGLVSLRLSGLYFALVTLVYGVMAQESIFAIESFTGGTAGNDAPRPTGFESEFRYYYFCLIGLVLVLFLDWRLLRTKAGRALLALRENPRVAQTWGINTKGYTLIAFMIAGMFAGLGGGLLAHRDLRVVAEPFNFNLALVFVLMTTVGGLRNRTGVVLGSLFFAFLRNGMLLDIVPGLDWFLDLIDLTPEIAPLVLGPVLLLLVLTLLPGGFGQLVKPLQQWLGGGRFRWVPADKEVTIDDVRA